MGKKKKSPQLLQQNSAKKNISLLEQITPMAQQINCLNINSIADVCINGISNLVGAKFASIYILDETSNILHLQQCNHPFLLNKIVSLNQKPVSPMIMAVKGKKIILVEDIDTHKKPEIKKSNRQFHNNYNTKNCIIAPLICHNKVVGVLNLADKMSGEGFGCEDVALIELFSQLIGASIGNIKMFEKIQQQATTDGLTGFVDHRTFYELLEKELWRSQRHGGQISLIMVDIDNLKTVNDVYGHRAGDQVIREVSRVIKECIRQVDIAARYGGDEFAIILPNTVLNDAVFAANRMVEAVANSYVNWRGEHIELSVSVGLGQYDANISPEDITSYSDQALYSAKKAGKSMVKVFESSLLQENS